MIPQVASSETRPIRDNSNSNRMEQTIASPSSMTSNQKPSDACNGDVRPIIVGYAFGPKKMKSMGVVMAEASMAVSTVVTNVPLISTQKLEPQVSLKRHAPQSSTLRQIPRKEPKIHHCHPPITTDLISKKDGVEDRPETVTVSNEDDLSFVSSVFSRGVDQDVISITSADGAHGNGNGIVHITLGRSFGHENESISLVESSSSPLISSPSVCHASSTDSSSNSMTTSIKNLPLPLPSILPKLHSIRVSFVPLDLDSPLEEQHGGHFDAILHKMTEDILYMSQLSMSLEHQFKSTSIYPYKQSNGMVISFDQSSLGSSEKCSKPIATTTNSSSPQCLNSEEYNQEILDRIRRLERYKHDNPSCCLLDHPSKVQAVMSRSDIAITLSDCLRNVTSASGLSVRTPRFFVLHERKDVFTRNGGCVSYAHKNTADGADTSRQTEQDILTFPLIAKPLTAAGTTESHKMAVVLGRLGMNLVHYPCILQEYVNHDERLYKVYVLGRKVWVFPRSSLPNLPIGEYSTEAKTMPRQQIIEFDSQKKYPQFSEFGIESDSSCERHADHVEVTVEEILPIADCLRRGFGLELFGFDVIVSRKSLDPKSAKEMLVIDVNYFPSYREVEKFPDQLAQHLAQCAIEGRVKRSESNLQH